MDQVKHVAIVHKDLNDEGRYLGLGERSFVELPRAGDLVATDDGENMLFLRVQEVMHVAELSTFIASAPADGYAGQSTHLYCKEA